jgi:adenosylcobyric acid synthase
MIQGTGSYVGKSILVTGLCRMFYQAGYRVAPFKAQNMSLNSYATLEGGEIGRAQAVQAEAAGIEPSVHMNPILLKPTGDIGSQVLIQGRPFKNLTAQEYYQYKQTFFNHVKQSYDWLAQRFELIVLEGAGSPAEINLKRDDIVNMAMARYAQAPVLLVTDIDRGGAFAAVIGTWEILDPEERKRVKGIIFNKFRGDVSLLKPGIEYLESRIGIPVLGVIPYLSDLVIEQEDSVWIEESCSYRKNNQINIAVIRLPRISNFTDFDPLAREPEVNLYYVKNPSQLKNPEIIILPGSKNTIADLLFLRESGLEREIINHAHQGCLIIGICGGYQMLGQVIKDHQGIESDLKETTGLGLLNISTTLTPEKITHQVLFRSISPISYLQSSELMKGYEIHMGITESLGDTQPLFQIISRSNHPLTVYDGAINKDKNVFGTYIHGIFENPELRTNILRQFRPGRIDTRLAQPQGVKEFKEAQYNRLAQQLSNCLDTKKIYALVNLPQP